MAAKIMLVEDDTNLSDIYKARFEAEGFQVSAAKDGEEALALAVKEHPDLIISDIMMPKISGFDMLDILRSTEGIKFTKVIMMTALGQAEDKARAEKLGADRYLVKSQVTLEDVVKAMHEVLGDEAAAPAPATAPASDAAIDSPAAPTDTTAQPTPAPAEPTVALVPVASPPADPTPAPPSDEPSAAQPAATEEPSTPPVTQPTTDSNGTDQKSAVLSQIQDFVNQQEATSQTKADNNKSLEAASKTEITVADDPPAKPSSANESTTDNVTIANKKMIKPPSDKHSKFNLQRALAIEESKDPPPATVAGTGFDTPPPDSGPLAPPPHQVGTVIAPADENGQNLDHTL